MQGLRVGKEQTGAEGALRQNWAAEVRRVTPADTLPKASATEPRRACHPVSLAAAEFRATLSFSTDAACESGCESG